jgi:hypothetical protein
MSSQAVITPVGVDGKRLYLIAEKGFEFSLARRINEDEC